MLTIEEFIKKIYQNPQSYFLYTLESIIDSKISSIQDYLEEEALWGTNPTLFIEIEESFKKLQKSPSWWYVLLSMFIPLDNYQEVHKKRLTVLLDTINIDYHKINLNIEKNNSAMTSIGEILEYLEKLKENLIHSHNLKQLDNNKFLVKEIDDKIILLKGYDTTLSLKKINLLELKKVYHHLKTKGLE